MPCEVTNPTPRTGSIIKRSNHTRSEIAGTTTALPKNEGASVALTPIPACTPDDGASVLCSSSSSPRSPAVEGVLSSARATEATNNEAQTIPTAKRFAMAIEITRRTREREKTGLQAVRDPGHHLEPEDRADRIRIDVRPKAEVERERERRRHV